MTFMRGVSSCPSALSGLVRPGGLPVHKRGAWTCAYEDVSMKPLGASGSANPPVSPAQSPEAAAESIPPPQPVEAPVNARFSGLKQVLVAGATGGVGREVVKQLTGKGVAVVALVRDPVAAAKKLPMANVELVKGDVYQYSSLCGPVEGCDAVICAIGTTSFLDPFGPFNVDYTGVVNLAAASERAGIKKFVLVSSIGTDEPAYTPFNLFWGILFWKKRAEEFVQRSGLVHTIVRPGGLVSDKSSSARSEEGSASGSPRGTGQLVASPAGTYGFPPKKGGSVLRSKVAECCIEALVQPGSDDSVLELVADPIAPALSWEQLFAAAKI